MDMDGRVRHRTAPPDHVDLEDLAALIDGRLPASDCSRVRAHLADCEECYEVFADVVRFKEEEGEAGNEERGGETGRVKPFPFDKAKKDFPRPWLAAAAAAALAAAMIGGWLGYRQLTPPTFDVAHLTAPFADRVALTQLWQEVRFRGSDEPSEQDNISVGLGVQLVDLQVVLARGNDPEAEDIHHVIVYLSGQLHFADHAEIEQAAELLKTASSHSARARALLVLQTSLRNNAEPVHFDLGRWAEASRLAAVTRQEAFFENRSNRRSLTWLARQDELTDSTRNALNELQEPWKNQELDQVANRLDHLISGYYRRQGGALPPPESLNPRSVPLPEAPPSIPTVPHTDPLADSGAPAPPAHAFAAAETPAPPARRSAFARGR